ncbi:MAG: hypothetical protein AB1801_11195 [Chloroflexota bacterium]
MAGGSQQPERGPGGMRLAGLCLTVGRMFETACLLLLAVCPLWRIQI